MRYGYKASAEQFSPRELLDYARLAEELGLETLAVSDHFQPWRHQDGHTPAVLPWLGALGERTSTALLGTSVLTPTMRYHPSIIAQNFATLACLNPGRVFLGVGTGEALNETPATAAPWPGAKQRRMMLGEAIELIRALWSQDRVTFEGEYYRTDRATIYDKAGTDLQSPTLNAFFNKGSTAFLFDPRGGVARRVTRRARRVSVGGGRAVPPPARKNRQD